MALDPAEILGEVDPENQPAAAPPAEADYRDADVQGISCASCSKFTATGWRKFGTVDGEEPEADREYPEIPTGYCGQWEALVDGLKVSNAYGHDSEPMVNHDGSENPDSEWNWVGFSAQEKAEYHEVYLSAAPAQERKGRLIKGILRTGEWDTTPTPFGKMKKPLKIVKDGPSDISNGVISISELLETNKAMGMKPMIPLSDKKNDDHINDGNLTRVNTGFVEDMFMEEDEDGVTHLMGDFGFTEPDVKDKVLRGTYRDVSAGLPVMTMADGSNKPFLEHVCITNTPFITGLKGYLTASDQGDEIPDNVEIHHHVLKSDKPSQDDQQKPDEQVSPLTAEQITELQEEFAKKFEIDSALYNFVPNDDGTLSIKHKETDAAWNVPFKDDDGFEIGEFADWEQIEAANTPDPVIETEDEPELPEATPLPSSGDKDLDAARSTREMRLLHNTTTTKETPMSLTTEQMDALGFTAEQKAAVTGLIDANAALQASSRTAEVDARIDHLKTIGLSDRPGFLKLYRNIALSDDGAPAAILLSDDGSNAKEKVTAKGILDQAIDALCIEDKITFSDQAIDTGADKPRQQSGDQRTPQQRADDMRESLGRPRLHS